MRSRVALIVLLVTASFAAATPAVAEPPIYWGVATHAEDGQDMHQVRRGVEDMIGRGFATFRKYANWNQVLPMTWMKNLWRNEGIVPVTAWTVYGKGDNDLRYWQVANGSRDDDIRAQARAIAAAKVPMIFTFQHEPEVGQGAKDPQAGPAEDYIAAFIRIYDIFETLGANEYLTWTNTLALAAFKENRGTPEDWTPPNRYFDWVGVDAYVRFPCVVWRDRPFLTFRQTFKEAHDFSVIRGKPLFIMEVGIVEQNSCDYPGDPLAKAAWVREASTVIKEWGNVTGITWSHVKKPFGNSFVNYHVDTSPASLEAFIEVGDDPYFSRFGAP